jgi:hypothetical protein
MSTRLDPHCHPPKRGIQQRSIRILTLVIRIAIVIRTIGFSSERTSSVGHVDDVMNPRDDKWNRPVPAVHLDLP